MLCDYVWDTNSRVQFPKEIYDIAEKYLLLVTFVLSWFFGIGNIVAIKRNRLLSEKSEK